MSEMLSMPREGGVQLGRYRLLSLTGLGSMDKVYLASSTFVEGQPTHPRNRSVRSSRNGLWILD